MMKRARALLAKLEGEKIKLPHPDQMHGAADGQGGSDYP